MCLLHTWSWPHLLHFIKCSLLLKITKARAYFVFCCIRPWLPETHLCHPPVSVSKILSTFKRALWKRKTKENLFIFFVLLPEFWMVKQLYLNMWLLAKLKSQVKWREISNPGNVKKKNLDRKGKTLKIISSVLERWLHGLSACCLCVKTGIWISRTFVNAWWAWRPTC